MKFYLLAIAVMAALVAPQPVTAKSHERHWQSGTLVDVRTETGSRLVGRMSAGAGTLSTRRNDATFYTVETPEYTYLAKRTMTRRNDKPLLVTVNTAVKFALEGVTVYLLDESGREHKLTLEKKTLNVRRPAPK
jgi:hypothetical protein